MDDNVGKKKKKTSRYYLDDTAAGDEEEGASPLRKSKSAKSESTPNSPKKGFSSSENVIKFTGDSEKVSTHDLSNFDPAAFRGAYGKHHRRKRQDDDDTSEEEDEEVERKMRKRLYNEREKMDPFPGDAPVPAEKKSRYKRGHKMNFDTVKGKHFKQKFEQKEKKIAHAVKQAARAEYIRQEEAGFVEGEGDELTSDITQHEIARSVDILSAQKFFDLKLPQFGPYRMNYTRNGRFLLIGGKKGHIAAMDWQTKKLMCEINVMETVQDVKWLHIETMYAVAQKQWTYIYDNQGIELHCLKALDSVLRMEFLPYHFLLASANAKSYLSYIDISIGQKVAGFPTGLGRLDVMCQNPRNAIIHLGHAPGTVSLWSPNVKEPLVKMLCHGGGTRSIAVDSTGYYMATSGVDRTLKIWDLRTYKTVSKYRIGAGASNLSFSQRGLLAAGIGNTVEIYKDPREHVIDSVYLNHRLPGSVQGLQFCPYEDVLGVGHVGGFSSLLTPGAGEPNFDALEANPYQSKQQRRQAEVKMLLEKIQPDMISLDTSKLGQVDTKTLQDEMEEKKKILYIKPQKVEFEPREKKKGRSKTGRLEKRKKGVKFERKQRELRDLMKQKEEYQKQHESEAPKPSKPYSVFDRFKKSKT